MKAAVVRPSELGAAERACWERFARDPSLSSPFLSGQFTQLIGQVRDDAWVAVVDDGPGIGGFLPFQMDSQGIGRPIGSGIADAQAFMCAPEWDFDPAELITAAGLRRWQFDHLVTTQRPFVPYHHRRHRSPIVHLADGHDVFLQKLRAHSKDLQAQVARRRRKLEREVGPVVCEWHSTQIDQDLRDLRRWKSDQYASTATWDRFAHPWIVDSLSQVAGSDDPACRGLLTVLRAGDRLVAAHLGLLGLDRLSWWFPAYDADFGRYSPGLILLLDLLAEAAARAVPLVDLGRGEHDYKLRVTPDFYEVAEGEVAAADGTAGP